MKSLLLLCLAFVATSAESATPPDPVESQYFITRTAIFWGTASLGLRYEIVLKLKQTFAKPVYATVEFENPLDPAAPFVAKPKLLAGEELLNADSDTFKAIRNPGVYTVKISLYEDAPRKILIGTHEQKVAFDVPKKVFKEMRLRKL
jgi:hypothetical protein